jgi:hypothetical protein
MSINQSQANAIATAVGPDAQKNIQRYVQARIEAAARAGLFSIYVDYDLSGTAGYELGLLGFGITQSGNQWVVDWSGGAPPPVPPIPGPTYVIPPVNGGTGINSYTIGDLIVATAATTLAKLAIGAANTVLTSSGSLPQWGLLTDNNISATADITLSKVNGGTANRLIASTGPLNRLAVLPAIAANRLLQSDTNGLPVALPAITPGRLLASNASGLPTALAAITPGHVLYADTNGLPVGEAVLAKSRGGAGADMSSVTFPSSGVLVTEAGSQVLTNKDYDGGTASNTRRLTVPQDTLANLNALTRKEATLVYANDVDKLYVDDGSALLSVGPFSPPLVTRYLSGSGTHNVNANTKYLRVRMLGAGGGGGGNSTTVGAFPGGAGGNTTFGTRTAGGGQGGSAALGGAGGTVSGSGYTIVAAVPGAAGAQTGLNPASINGTQMPGGMGGSSFFGGAGRNGAAGDPGGAAVANSGSGGGGGGTDNVASQYGGGGGGAGAYLEFIITNPDPSYSYSVGAGGAGSTGASRNGGPGGSGVLIVEEYS